MDARGAAGRDAGRGRGSRYRAHRSFADRLLCSVFKIWTACRIGSDEIRITPPKPCSSSRIMAMAPATASAHNVNVTAHVRLRGAKRPKLANSKVNQKTR